jgi:hypothetical protein
MTADEMFALWAPEHSPWSQWTKPVLFAQVNSDVLAHHQIMPPPLPEQNAPPWLPRAADRVALVVDCPGSASVWFAMTAAAAGYRPIPLFNALPGPMAGAVTRKDPEYSGPLELQPKNVYPLSLVEVWPTLHALIAVSERLQQFNLPAEAPPAFLLDANRRTGVGPLVPNRFDNRSVTFPTDFPSANYLLSQGIKRVLLIQMRAGQPQPDLAHTLLRWQEAGIEIASVGLENGEPQRCQVEKPSLFRVLWYRLAMLAGLSPQLEGFGAIIPEPSSG